MRRLGQPKRVMVSFKGIDYEMNVTVCHHALVRRQIEGQFDSMESLAQAADRSRSTVSRFFAGRQTSLSVALAILSKLKLDFDDVFALCDFDQD
jgi:hypothetical protein